jgi:hypothetical protein
VIAQDSNRVRRLYIFVRRLYLRSSMSRLRWNLYMPKPALIAGLSACSYSARPAALETPAPA